MEVMTIVAVSSLAGFVAGYGVRAAISRRRRLRRGSSRLRVDTRYRLVPTRGTERRSDEVGVVAVDERSAGIQDEVTL